MPTARLPPRLDILPRYSEHSRQRLAPRDLFAITREHVAGSAAWAVAAIGKRVESDLLDLYAGFVNRPSPEHLKYLETHRTLEDREKEDDEQTTA